MNRRAPLLVACSALALLSGCGSSGKSTSGAGATSTPSRTTPSGGLKITATPRYGSPAPSAPVQSGTVQIAYRNITINPDTLKVKVGSTIVWTNHDSIKHNVTSEEGPAQFKSPDFGEGGTFRVKLTRPGVIHYECTLHPASMNGTIEVLG